MSEHNIKTINMYNSGGAVEYIGHNNIEPETEKWERLFNYVEKELQNDIFLIRKNNNPSTNKVISSFLFLNSKAILESDNTWRGVPGT